MIDKKKVSSEKAVLIGIITHQQDIERAKEYLDELEFLTLTAGGKAVKRFTQNLDMPNPKTFIGSGKLDEVKRFIDSEGIETAIFDDELYAAQLRNI